MKFTGQTHRKRSLFTASLAAVVTMALAGCVPGGSTPDGGSSEGGGGLAGMEPMVLTISELTGQEGAQGQMATAFMKYVEEKTGGKVTFEPYWKSSLFSSAEALAQTGAGVADIAITTTGSTPNELPIANYLLEFGASFEGGHPFDLLQGTAWAWDVSLNNPEVIAEYEANGVHLLATSSTTKTSMMCTKPVSDLASAAGKRARVSGPTWTAEAESLGLVPQTLPPAESFEALQRGILDCQVQGAVGLSQFGIPEVAKYFVDVPFSAYPGSNMMMNLDRWNSLPDEVKQIFAEGVVMGSIAEAERNTKLHRDFAENAATKHGVIFTEAPELVKAMRDAQAKRLENLAELAPDVVQDPEKLAKDNLDSLDEWSKVLSDAGVPKTTSGFVEDAKLGTELKWQDALREAMLKKIEGKYYTR
ncbi:TRAP transporter substrate-binding protein DctP [Paenarthrobacter aurescens]|uniref:TRAP transporter substrate-binding protein DctP n=1 Tax=Paenarthrobacter aurescens TaxID=43663 RepID=UPI0035EB5D53